MSDERLANIETKLDQLIAGPVLRLETDVQALKAHVQSLQTGQGRLEADVSSLTVGQECLGTDVSSLKVGLADTRTEMRLLHESTKAEIRVVAEGLAAHREETRRGFDKVLTRMAELLAPVTAAVAHHSNVLDDHEHRLRAVEEP